MSVLQSLVSNDLKKQEMRNFFLFSIGKLISIFGTSIYTFAMGLYVLKTTGSGLSFATTLVLGIIPAVVFNPPAGVVVDRFTKKYIVVAMDLLCGLLLLLVYLFSSFYGLNIILIYAATFLMTSFTVFFDVALEASKPNIVTQNLLMNINSISKIIDSVASILGPVIGGMIFALLDIKLFLIVNGISFVFSAICEMFMNFNLNRQKTAQEKKESHVNFRKDLMEGLNYLLKKKEVKSLLIIFVVVNFFLGFSVNVPLPYIVNNVLHMTSKEFGMIEAAFPVGMIIGAIFVGKINQIVTYDKLIKSLNFGLSFCILMLALPVVPFNMNFSHMSSLIYYSSFITMFGIMIAFIDIPIAYMLQTIIPEEYRGRVMSIGISIGKTMLPIGLIISGSLINILPAYMIPSAGGILMLLFSLAIYNSKVSI